MQKGKFLHFFDSRCMTFAVEWFIISNSVQWFTVFTVCIKAMYLCWLCERNLTL